MKLRYYQKEAINSIYNYYSSGNLGNPILALPTGTGKSVVIAGFLQSVFHQYSNQRILILTHVKELIEQNYEKLINVWQEAPAGICSASVGRKDTHFPIIFAGIQTIKNHLKSFLNTDLILIDECHLVSDRAGSTYNKFITTLKEHNNALKVIGLTATPYRLDSGLLVEGDIFTDVCYDLTTPEAFNRLIKEGYLSNLINTPIKDIYDTSSIRMKGGDYDLQELSDFMESDYDKLKSRLADALPQIKDRTSILIFATSIKHCHMIKQALNELGENSNAIITGDTPKLEREKIVKEFRERKIRFAINVNVLTTGFDAPNVDSIICLRPTESVGLWVQMIGRGLRIAENKSNCLVLDYTPNTRDLGAVNNPRPPRKKKGSKQLKKELTQCVNCGEFIQNYLIECPICHHIKEGKERKLELEANAESEAQILEKVAKMPKPPEKKEVKKMVISKHIKRSNGNESVRFRYIISEGVGGINEEYSEYVSLQAYPLIKFNKFLIKRLGEELPTKEIFAGSYKQIVGYGTEWSIDEVISYLKENQQKLTPTHIYVDFNDQYPKITNKDFAPNTATLHHYALYGN